MISWCKKQPADLNCDSRKHLIWSQKEVFWQQNNDRPIENPVNGDIYCVF